MYTGRSTLRRLKKKCSQVVHTGEALASSSPPRSQGCGYTPVPKFSCVSSLLVPILAIGGIRRVR
eukprot:624557-Pelagomonas_calceolata.AAC.6